jgi:hypothetical protein
MDIFRGCNQCNSPNESGGRIQVQGAIIEDIFINNRTGNVTISYGVMGNFNMIHKELVVLIVNQDTNIRSRNGQSMTIRDLRIGMIIDATFSSAMTRSMPPQAVAYQIIVVGAIREFETKIGRVMSIDLNNQFFVTGREEDLSSQMRFVVSNATIIRDARGNQIPLRNLRIGSKVRVEHATFQTASIPPQTTAYNVQVL